MELRTPSTFVLLCRSDTSYVRRKSFHRMSQDLLVMDVFNGCSSRLHRNDREADREGSRSVAICHRCLRDVCLSLNLASLA